MFWGEYAHQLDSKGRLIIPSRLRDKLTDDAILTRGLDHNLVIYPASTWKNVTTQLNEMPITHPTARALRRLLFSGAVEISLDKQGRVNIPNYLLEYASIEDSILLVGMETFIELWQPDQWRTTLDNVAAVLAESDHLLTLNV
ncbi:MAG: division/cell wall cluster transcriptional repressor MraZ [Phototrophicaceae bacterium]